MCIDRTMGLPEGGSPKESLVGSSDLHLRPCPASSQHYRQHRRNTLYVQHTLCLNVVMTVRAKPAKAKAHQKQPTNQQTSTLTNKNNDNNKSVAWDGVVFVLLNFLDVVMCAVSALIRSDASSLLDTASTAPTASHASTRRWSCHRAPHSSAPLAGNCQAM